MIPRNTMHVAWTAASLLLLASTAMATPGVEPVLRRTPHLELVADTSLSDRLDSLAPVAEAIWERLATATGHRPRTPIRVVFHDHDDYANGWAIASNGWVNVWMFPQPFALRGGSDWLRNVLSHEMAHVFTLQALGLDGHLLSVGAAVSHEERTGFARADLSWDPQSLDSWLVEGLAQVGAEFCDADSWDGHRDLLERVAWKSGRTLSDGLSRDFWGDARESELVYNQGYSFLRYVLLEGEATFPQLLAEGRRSGLRRAVEISLGKTFAESLEGWRAHLATRHGDRRWPEEGGRALLPHDKATTWVLEGSAVGDSRRRWVTSSRSNDYGLESLWEVDGRKVRHLADDVVGRLHWHAERGLLVVREHAWPDRRTIRDLWSYRPDTRKWTRITTRGRVMDADHHPEGYVAIVREPGRVSPVVLDGAGGIVRRLPLPTGGDLVQVAADAAGGIVATVMGSGGFQVLALAADSTWERLAPQAAQSRDPVHAGGAWWASFLEEGRWSAHVRTESGTWSRVFASEGGVLSPHPIGPDSLLVSRHQAEGLVAVAVSLSESVQTGALPAGRGLSPGALAVKPLVPRREENFSLPSLLGYGFQAGYMSQADQPGQVYQIGSKWMVGGGVAVSTPTLETILGLDVMGLHAGPDRQPTWDKGILLSASTERWSPVIAAEASYQELTLRRLEVDSLDSLEAYGGDTLPFLAQSSLQARIYQSIGDRSSIQVGWSWLTQGVGLRKVTDGGSVVLAIAKVLDVGWVWQDLEPGRHGILSGSAVALQAGRVWNDATVLLEESSAWLLGGQVYQAGHLGRRVLLDAQAVGQWVVPEFGGGTGRFDFDASAAIPLGRGSLSVPVTRHRGWTFVDPLLRIGPSLSLVPASLEVEQSIRPVAQAHRGFQPAGPSLARAALLVDDDLRLLPSLGVQLTWKTLTLANRATRWSFGVSIPPVEDRPWSDTRWTASLSL